MPYRYGYERYSLGRGDGKGGYPPGGGLAPSWTPADLASLVHWYRASDLVGYNDTDPVGTWPDTAGSSDATSAGSARPLYRTGSGQPYLQFDGTDDTLHATVTGLTDLTWVVILSVQSAVDYERILEDSVLNVHVIPSINSRIQFELAPAVVNAFNTLPAQPTGIMSVFASRGGTSAKLRVDGTEATGTMATTTSGTTLRMAEYTSAGYNLQANFYEVIVCNTALTGSDFTSLAAYLSDSYGVTL